MIPLGSVDTSPRVLVITSSSFHLTPMRAYSMNDLFERQIIISRAMDDVRARLRDFESDRVRDHIRDLMDEWKWQIRATRGFFPLATPATRFPLPAVLRAQVTRVRCPLVSRRRIGREPSRGRSHGAWKRRARR